MKELKMYNVIFYEDKNGYSELNEELIRIAKGASANKDLRIQHKQITYCIELLKNQGTRLPINIAKHIDDDIWELGQETIGCYISISKTIHSCSCICLKSKHKRLHLQK